MGKNEYEMLPLQTLIIPGSPNGGRTRSCFFHGTMNGPKKAITWFGFGNCIIIFKFPARKSKERNVIQNCEEILQRMAL